VSVDSGQFLLMQSAKLKERARFSPSSPVIVSHLGHFDLLLGQRMRNGRQELTGAQALLPRPLPGIVGRPSSSGVSLRPRLRPRCVRRRRPVGRHRELSRVKEAMTCDMWASHDKTTEARSVRSSTGWRLAFISPTMASSSGVAAKTGGDAKEKRRTHPARPWRGVYSSMRRDDGRITGP